jgi:DNA-binding NarL/FixJ family response regulator
MIHRPHGATLDDDPAMTKTVLIVDDHAGFRSIATLLVQSAGYDVIGEAADGAEALAAVEQLHPDAVLLDVELPDMTGFAVAEQLAARAYPPAVVLISGRRRTDFGAKLAEAPALGFVAKDDLSEQRLVELLR